MTQDEKKVANDGLAAAAARAEENLKQGERTEDSLLRAMSARGVPAGVWRGGATIVGVVVLLLGLLFGQPAEASPFPWNPFSATMRADNTMTVRGSVTDFQVDVPLGGCTFELHHSESLNGVQVVLDATRGRDCKAIRMALAKVLDPEMARIIVKAKGRVVVSETGDGIGEEARSALVTHLAGITCTATKGAHPSLALDPLQRVKQELDVAAKRIPDGSLVLAKARAEIVNAQDDLEMATNLTGAEPVCNMVGVSELRKLLEGLPTATRQTLHATGVQVDRD